MTQDLPQRIREPHEGNHLSRPRQSVKCPARARSARATIPEYRWPNQPSDRSIKQLLQSPENSLDGSAQSVGIECALDKAALELPRKQGVAVLHGEIQP